MKRILLHLIAMLPLPLFGQVLYNPFVSNATISPAPMAYSYQGGSALIAFTFGNNGTATIPLIPGQPLSMNITMLRGVVNAGSVVEGISGSMAQYFTWTGVGGSISGMQRLPIPANLSGSIIINYRATSNSTIASQQNGLNVNLAQSPIIAGHNLQADDNVSIFTYTQQIGLPVNLIDFRCDKMIDRNLLSWQTQQEVNCDYFSIYHGSSLADLQLLATIDAQSKDMNLLEYEYLYSHYQPSIGDNYYRLTSTDKDGKQQVHKTIHVYIEKKAALNVLPNPTTDDLLIDYEGGELNMLNISLFDFQGRAVLDEKVIFDGGVFQKRLSLRHLPNGIYFLKLTDFEGFMRSEKIIKK